MDKKDLLPTPEELASEQQALSDVKEEEVRSSIIEEFGFDETKDGDKIDKLTKKEIDNRRKLSSAIGQKIKYRNQLGNDKDPKGNNGTSSSANLSLKEIAIVAKANIHEDDIDDVAEYASFKKIPFVEALKLTEVKAKLAEKAEFRKSAEIANAGGSKRTPTKPSPDKLMSDLSAGKVPEKGSAEAEELFWARRKRS